MSAGAILGLSNNAEISDFFYAIVWIKGFVMNLQPSEAEAGFDIRIPPTADLQALERRVIEEWAPPARNMSFELWRFDQNLSGKQSLTAKDYSNLWWGLLENAVNAAGGKTSEPEIFPASTDSKYFRKAGLPAIGFSPISNTPSLLHDHKDRKLLFVFLSWRSLHQQPFLDAVIKPEILKHQDKDVKLLVASCVFGFFF